MTWRGSSCSLLVGDPVWGPSTAAYLGASNFRLLGGIHLPPVWGHPITAFLGAVVGCMGGLSRDVTSSDLAIDLAETLHGSFPDPLFTTLLLLASVIALMIDASHSGGQAHLEQHLEVWMHDLAALILAGVLGKGVGECPECIRTTISFVHILSSFSLAPSLPLPIPGGHRAGALGSGPWAGSVPPWRYRRGRQLHRQRRVCRAGIGDGRGG